MSWLSGVGMALDYPRKSGGLRGTTIKPCARESANDRKVVGGLCPTVLVKPILMASLRIWYRALGSVAIDTVTSPKSEMFYWVTIMFSQTLGTALGDWTADTAGLGYSGGAVVFGSMLAILAAAYYRTTLSRTTLFWAAFILTRPLGAVVGDLLDKPISQGGLALSRYSASAALLVLIASCILIFSQKAAKQGH